MADTVTIRCRRNAERTFRPVWGNSRLAGSSNKSVGSRVGGTNTRDKGQHDMAMCAEGVRDRHTPGLTLLPVRSSKGKGTRITLWRIRQWYSLNRRINVLGRVGKKTEGAAG